MSQGALSKLVGVSQATINRYETGVIPMSPLAVRPISEALGCSEEWLASGEGDEFVNTDEQVSVQQDDAIDTSGQSIMETIARLRGVVSTTVGFKVTDDQALEWAIRKAGVAAAVYAP